MDIAITLPKHLWKAICSGDKIYECRKRLPRNFMRVYDKCWVILKGTNDVAGYFYIDHFFYCINVEDIEKNFLDRLCVDKTWFERYAKRYDVLHLWKIGRPVYELTASHNRDEFLDIPANPQSYVYCRPTCDSGIRYIEHIGK